MNSPKESGLQPRIYAASLADYNAGRLHGRWIDCTQGIEGVRQEIEAMLAESPEPVAEEWAIHDFEGFGAVRLDEYEDLERVVELAELIEEHREFITHLVRHCGGLGQLDEAKRIMEEDYAGEADSLEDWAGNLLEETGELGEVPEHLRPYINFEKYGRDLELGGDIFTIETGGRVHVFWNR